MTNEEAIKELETDSCYECTFGCVGVVDCEAGCEYQHAIWKSVQALKKQMPKPPKHDYDKAKNLTYYKCPTCGEDVITFIPENRMTIKEHHCRCGQALLWGKE